jgi:hypothetical protein
MHGRQHCVMGDVVGHDDRDVALGGLEFGHRLENRDLPLDNGFQVEFEQQWRMRELPALAPTRVQFTDYADLLAVQPDAGTATGMQGWMVSWFELGLQGDNRVSTSPLTS